MNWYVDTNVIMDFLIDRDSTAHHLLMKEFLCKFTIIVSSVVLAELTYQQLEAKARTFFELGLSTGKLRVFTPTSKHKQTARTLTNQEITHYNDALHATLAREYAQGRVLKKNLKDFRHIPGITATHPDNF